MEDIAGSMISAWFVISVENALGMDQYVFHLADLIELLVNFEFLVVLGIGLGSNFRSAWNRPLEFKSAWNRPRLSSNFGFRPGECLESIRRASAMKLCDLSYSERPHGDPIVVIGQIQVF